jgi:hypothetical protein
LETEASAIIRFNGVAVGWGDIGYHPTGGGAGEAGHFRFSVSGSSYSSVPDAVVGVGGLNIYGGTLTAPSGTFSDTAYPVVRSNRTTTGLNDYAAAMAVRHTTTGGAMTDGYGVSLNFELVDTDAISNVAGNIGFVRSGADNTAAFIIQTALAGVVTERLRLTNTTLTLADAINIALGTTTGTKFGTATTHKLAFYNATPIVQPASTTDLRLVLINLGLLAAGGATPLNLNGGLLTAADIIIDDAVGTNRQINFNTSGVARWIFQVTSTAESGANAGSNLNLLARDDAGAAVSTVMSIVRATGVVTFRNAIVAPGAGTADATNFALNTNGSARLTVLSTGEIGIGTTAPARLFHVHTATVADHVLLSGVAPNIDFSNVEAGTIQARIGMATAASHYFSGTVATDLVITGNTSTGSIVFGTGSPAAERMRVDENGIVSMMPNTLAYNINTRLHTYIDHTVVTGSQQYSAILHAVYSAAQPAGFKMAANIGATATHTTGTTLDLIGTYTFAANNGSGGTVTTARALKARIDTATGAITTTGRVIEIDNGIGAGTLQTQVGLYINSLTEGSVANYGIYSVGSQASVHVGDITIGVAQDPAANVDLSSGVDAQKLLVYHSGNARYGHGMASSEMRTFIPNTTSRWAWGTVSTTDGSTWAELARFENTGELGIGSTTPIRKLHVHSSASSHVALTGSAPNIDFHTTEDYSGVGNVGEFRVGMATGVNHFLTGTVATDAVLTTTTATGSIIFGTGTTPSERMRIDEAGLVGIGTSGPAGQLHVLNSQSAATILRVENASAAGAAASAQIQVKNGDAVGIARMMAFGASFTTAGAYLADSGAIESGTDLASGLSIIAAHSTGAMRFYTGGTATSNERLRITSTGLVGVGTTIPQNRLQLTRASNFGIELDDPGTPSGTPSTTGGSMAAGTYYYTIVAFDGVGYGSPSAESAAIVTTTATSSVALTWASASGAAGYRVYRTTTSGSYPASSLIATVTTNAHTDTLLSPSAGTLPTTNNAYSVFFGGQGNFTADSWLLGSYLGIGTSVPDSPLCLVGAAGAGGTVFASLGDSRWRMKRIAGDDTAAGTIDHRQFDSTALSIVGGGTFPDRFVRIWDVMSVNIAPVANTSLLVSAVNGSIGVHSQTGVATAIGLVVEGFTSQSGNLAEWRASGGAVYGTISENGYYTTRKTAAPADAELAAGELAFWFDSTNGAAKLMIKAKEAGGTVRTGSVALA